ncbi:hypothetical protein ACJJTC_005149 [Scirpophaga incertulas]
MTDTVLPSSCRHYRQYVESRKSCEMRCLVLLLLLALGLSYATPIDSKRWLINHHEIFRDRRSPQYTKGNAPAKTQPKLGRVPLTKMELSLRKGEYICGDRICKLQPGEVPKHCVHCQYRI